MRCEKIFGMRTGARQWDGSTSAFGSQLPANGPDATEPAGKKPDDERPRSALSFGSRVAAPMRALFLVLAFGPLAVCYWSGALRTSLWLDEITYGYYEGDDAMRAAELGRPGSQVAPHLSVFSYCDLQRVFHETLGRTPRGSQISPEVSARLIALGSAVLLVLLAYTYAIRNTGSDVQALTAALALSSTPLFLHYAFEGRVYAFAALAATAYLWISSVALKRGGWWVGLAGLAGYVTQRANWWLICIPLALACWGAWEVLRDRVLSRRHGWLLTAIAPALAVGAAEYLFVTRVAGDGAASPFPLFLPRGILSAIHMSLFSIFVPWGAGPSAPHQWVAIAGGVLILLLVVVSTFWLGRRSRKDLPVAAISLLALVISVLAGGHFGAIVFGRHQVGMVVALLFGLGAVGGRVALVGRVILISLNLAFLPNAIDIMNDKGNGKAIAILVRTHSSDAANPALVVQHTLRLGYPDPLNSIGAAFYINDLRKGVPLFPLYELPDHRSIVAQRTVYRYFNGGPKLLSFFASCPEKEWDTWLRSTPHDILWFIWPDPATREESSQTVGYLHALRNAGFSASEGSAFRLSGYPPSVVQKFVRSP